MHKTVKNSTILLNIYFLNYFYEYIVYYIMKAYTIEKVSPQSFCIVYVSNLIFENYTSLLRHLFKYGHQRQPCKKFKLNVYQSLNI